MPRKNISPAVKTLIRDNQRRSRARQKELVQDLQRRLEDYERRGVQASIHMQNAARAVSEENQQLRSLLSRYGVSSDEIEQHLRHNGVGRDYQHVEAKGGNLHRISNNFPTCPSPTNKNQQHSFHLTETETSPESPRSPSQIGTASPTSIHAAPNSADIRGDRSVSLPNQDEYGTRDFDDEGLSFFNVNTEAATKPTGEPKLYPRTDILKTASGSRITTSGMDMPCELAASIVADVQGHGDETLIYPALGCSATRKCLVRNVTILDLIDKNI